MYTIQNKSKAYLYCDYSHLVSSSLLYMVQVGTLFGFVVHGTSRTLFDFVVHSKILISMLLIFFHLV